MKELSLIEFATMLGGMALEVQHQNREALKEAAELVEKGAKEAIGTYEYGWPQLAESTQRDRENKGFPANEPLLRTGEMRDSIQHSSDHHEARIGSNSDIALYQEMGTATIPPRSFLKETLVHDMPKIMDIVGRNVIAAFAVTKLLP